MLMPGLMTWRAVSRCRRLTGLKWKSISTVFEGRCSRTVVSCTHGHRFYSTAATTYGRTTVSACFSRLLQERALIPNVSQTALVAELQRLQDALESCAASGTLQLRLCQAFNELAVPMAGPLEGDSASVASSPWMGKWVNAFKTLVGDSPLSPYLQSLGTRTGLRASHVENQGEAVEVRASEPFENSSGCTGLLNQQPYPLHLALRCLYVWGGVGQGKTLLMNAFYDTTPFPEKLRIHFHEFMLDVQERLHALQTQDRLALSGSVRPNCLVGTEHWDHVTRTAYSIAQQYRLICLDEFQVVHIADAMILKRLLEALWHFGTVIVATSNRPPEDLYKGGLNRDRFIPFIELVQKRWTVFQLSVNRDFRQEKRRCAPFESQSSSSALHIKSAAYFVPPRPLSVALKEMQNETGVRQRIHSNAAAHPVMTPTVIEIPVCMGRHLRVPYASGTACLCPFAFLCDAAVGSADYVALTKAFDTLYLYDVPSLKDFDQDGSQIRRFIQLIDVLYEHRLRLVIDSAVPILHLFGASSTTAAFDTFQAALRTAYPTSASSFFKHIRDSVDARSAPMSAEALRKVLVAVVSPTVAEVVVGVLKRAILRHASRVGKSDEVALEDLTHHFSLLLRGALEEHAGLSGCSPPVVYGDDVVLCSEDSQFLKDVTFDFRTDPQHTEKTPLTRQGPWIIVLPRIAVFPGASNVFVTGETAYIIMNCTDATSFRIMDMTSAAYRQEHFERIALLTRSLPENSSTSMTTTAI